MRAHRALPVAALALAALVGLLPSPAGADDAGAPGAGAVTDAVERLLEDLGAPAHPEAVRRLLLRPEVRDTGFALMLVRAWTAAGGVSAADGLLVLAEHRNANVRAWALRGVSVLGIRTSRGVDAVRRALASPDPTLRRNACWALAVVGDGSDVPALLAIAHDADDPVAGHALATVQRLGGLKGGRFRTVARVESWWHASAERMHREVAEALDAIEAGGADPLADARRQVLVRAGWVDPASVVERLRDWLSGTDARLRLEALRLAETMRLGDLAEALGADLAYENDDACLVAGARTAREIGVPLAEGVLARIRKAQAQLGRPVGEVAAASPARTTPAPEPGPR